MADQKISAMTPGAALSGAEQFEMNQGGTFRTTSDDIKGYVVRARFEYEAPLTGVTFTPADNTQVVLIEPGGTIATHTLKMPPSPSDGDQFRFSTVQTITTLTLDGNGATIVNPITTLAANGFAAYQYRSTGAKWYRIG